MSESCKYYKEYNQVSYDEGKTYQFVYPLVYRKGDFIADGTKECLTRQPLTFVATSNSSFSFNSPLDPDCNPLIASLQYSINGGQSWHTLRANSESVSINSGKEIMWRGNLSNRTVNRFVYLVNFSASTGTFEVEGNANSLWFGDEFSGQTNSVSFQRLFSGCTRLTSAENLILPALQVNDLSSNVYESMFEGCTNLITAPELPAYFIGLSCYKRMFYGCSSLNYIKCTATEVHWVGGVHKPTEDWVVGVPSNGIFIKTEGANWWMDYDNGIPEGWIVINV